ncbi:MAG: Uma2 family endonuclease, partial [Acidobacteria bacterium]|nr:Uma2 family endonuclease [Acidobacteriota bacterium]
MASTAHVAADLHAETYRWSREVYDRAVVAGVFGPEDLIELIDGELLTTPLQGSRHAAIATRVGEALGRTLGRPGHVRTQMPLAASGDSESEPDLAVVPGDALDYL